MYIDKNAEMDVNEGVHQLEYRKSDACLGGPSVSMANILEVIYI